MECPNCGVENPEEMLSCGICAESIAGFSESADDPREEGASGLQVDEVAPRGSARGAEESQSRMFTMAVVAAAAALALLLVALLLYVYYYERVMSPNRDFEDYQSMFNIVKFSLYARMFGEAAAILGILILVKAVLKGGFSAAPALMRRVDLANVFRLVVLMLVLIAIVTAVMIYIYEAEPDLGVNAMKVLSRTVVYLPLVTTILGTGTLLLVSSNLRTASVDARAAGLALPSRND